ncbi:Ada metal-binding domain-containing protein [Holophaga foetida]|uniref:Ada metal-binding domain-containing protein n=1 Tax=Holophaga foetida TaxID=35839 RepID=UPI0002472130|nr:Ada metal-binding domain-containing protein [Holophaga foetida]
MKLLPALVLLSCSLVFAQTPSPAAKAKVASPVGEVVANKESKVFHKPTCKLAVKIKAENKASLASKADAAKDGYKACKICKP